MPMTVRSSATSPPMQEDRPVVSSAVGRMRAGAIYEPSVPEGFEWVLPTDDRAYESLRDGPRPDVQDEWEAPQMRLLRADDGATLRRAAMPWLGSHVLVLRDEAIHSVGGVLAAHGTLAPLLCAEAKLVAFLAPLLHDVLDEARSEIVRFSSGRIMTLVRPAFRYDRLPEEAAFRLAEFARGPLFLTEALVRRIEATADTSGTDFVEVDR